MINSTAIGNTRAIWLLLRLQAVRYARQLAGGFRLFRKSEANAKRTATAGKSKQSWLIGSLVALSLVFTFTNLAHQSISNIKERAGSIVVSAPPNAKSAPGQKQSVASKPQPARSIRMPLAAAPGFTLPPNVLKAVTLQALFFLFAITLLVIGNGELTQQDWDLEWLVTLPVRLSTLLCSRILTRAFANQMGLFVFLPFLSVLAWEAGYRFTAPLLGFVAIIPLLIVVATTQTLVDTGLRLRLGPSQLRNLQAFISIAAVLMLFLGMSPGMPSKGTFVVDWASAMPSWMFWLPPGLAIQTVTASATTDAMHSLGLLAIEAGVFALLGLAVLKRQLRFGIVSAGSRESGRRLKLHRAIGEPNDQPARRSFLTPIQMRELRLLGRDRNFLVQTLIMPIVIVAVQIVFNGSGTALFASAHSHPEYLASIAFGISAYALMFSAFQTLNAEGQALWILYTVPQSMESILRQKAALWSVASLVYPALIFGFVIASQATVSLQLLGLATIVFIGVPIFALIATSLGIFACDPLAQNVQKRVKLSYTYLYLMLGSTYIYAVYVNMFWQRLSLMILTALLAVALWQKARDHLPYLLDPAASPPARVSVSDGLIAALLFFVLQGVVTLIRVGDPHNLTGFDVLVAFSIAGGTTFAIMRLAFWRLKSEGVPRTFGRNNISALVLGVLAGTTAAAVALLYLKLAAHTPLLENAQKTVLLGDRDASLLALLAIVFAPIFEEFIFRGLIFGGLRRSMGVSASVLASAAIFAIVHPAASVIPVFGLGIATALVYERTKLLIGPMTTHAVYNAFVVGFQFLV